MSESGSPGVRMPARRSRVRACASAVGACVLLAFALPTVAQSPAPLATPNLELWRGGTVRAVLVLADGSTILGGTFASVYVPAFQLSLTRQNLAKFDADGNLDLAWNPDTDGDVQALATDGTGAVFIAGTFSTVSGATRNGIAKVSLADGAIDLAWDPAPVGNVRALAYGSDGMLYAGGSFSSIGTQTRANLARLDPAGTGAADPAWNPAPGGAIAVLRRDASNRIYAGGTYATIAGQSRNSLARFDASGAIDSAWNPGTNVGGEVRTIAFDGSGDVYAGGNFSSLGGQGVGNVGKVSGSGTGAPLPNWNPFPNSTVDSLAVDAAGAAYIGGNFTAIGGNLRAGLAKVVLGQFGSAVDASWNPGPNFGPTALAFMPSGDVVVAGFFDRLAGQSILGYATVTPGNASVVTKREIQAAGVATSIVTNANGTYVAGNFARASGAVRTGLLKLASDGTLDAAWDPAPNKLVNALALDAGGNVLVGGQFTQIGGQARNFLARLSGTGTGAVDAGFNPAPNGDVGVVALDNLGAIYVAGSFATIAGQGHTRLAKLASNGAGDATWNPAPSAVVYALTPDSAGSIYAGGGFGTIGGQTRTGLAKLSTTGTGAADATWNPAPTGVVFTLALDGAGSLYAGGTFAAIGGQTRARLAKLSTTGAGLADPNWNPSAPGPVVALALDSTGFLFVGGTYFGTLGGQSRFCLARLSGTGSGVADFNWKPQPNFTVQALALDANGTVYAGGAFETIGGAPRRGLAALPIQTNGIFSDGYD